MSPQDLLQLRDIHLPPAPGLWPPAPGWWVLTIGGLLLLVWAGVTARRRWLHLRLRRRVLAALAAVPTDGGTRTAAEVSALLKRVALARFPRERVAPLVGDAWLAFLDRTGGGDRFRSGAGRVLAEAPYAPARPLDLGPLLALARDWVKINL